MRVPSVENATELADEVWPFSTFSCLPVDESHTRTDLSFEPETMRVPSVENATELTDQVWPSSTFSCLPVDASHTRNELSREPETMCVPSVENVTDSTPLPTLRCINNIPLREALVNDGIPGKRLLHPRQGSDSPGHVESAET